MVAKKAAGRKQKDLPNMEGPGVAQVNIPEIDALAESYIKERDKRCRQTPHEIAAKDKLVAAIHEHKERIGVDSNGEVIYRFDNVVVTLKPGKEELKVKELKNVEITAE